MTFEMMQTPPPEAVALLPAASRATPVAWDEGRPVVQADLLAAAARLAVRLPDRGPAINACADRRAFVVALLAAAMRGHPQWLPGQVRPAALEALRRRAGDDDAQATPYLLVDDGQRLDGLGSEGDGAMPTITVPRSIPAAQGAEAPAPTQRPDFEWVRLYTSGSTGEPQPHAKQVRAIHRNIAAEAERIAQWLGRVDLSGVSIVATVPPQHSYGFESSVLLALVGGATLDTAPAFYPADIAAALARVPQPRMLVTTPFHLKALLDSNVALPAVDLVLSATAPLTPQLAARAEAATGGRVGEIYGCTEAGQVAARLTCDGPTWTTLGALRLHQAPGDADPHGAPRSVVSGGHVLEPTVLADVLHLHDDRRFELLGRSNDIVHVAGKRASMAQLDFELNRVPGVVDGAFWLPDDEGGARAARPVAIVVAPELAAAALIEALRARLEPAFVPRRVVHVPALPREATGKLTRAALQALVRRVLVERHVVRWRVEVDHPAFDGHFPGAPVLPGAALLGRVLQAALAWPEGRERLGALPAIDTVKFLAPVRPGDDLEIALETVGAEAVTFEITRTATPQAGAAARGRLAAGSAPAAR